MLNSFRKVTQPILPALSNRSRNAADQQYAGFSYTTRQMEMLQTIPQSDHRHHGGKRHRDRGRRQPPGGTQGNAGNQLVDTKTKRSGSAAIALIT